MDKQLKAYFLRRLNEIKQRTLDDSLSKGDLLDSVTNLISLLEIKKYTYDSVHDRAYPLVEEQY